MVKLLPNKNWAFISCLMVFLLINIVSIAHLLQIFLIEHDSDSKLKILQCDYRSYRKLIKDNLSFALIVFSLTLFLAACLEWTATLTKSQKILIFMGAGVYSLMASFVYPVTSCDIYLYISYGRELAVLGFNPYVTALDGLVRDAVISQLQIDYWKQYTAPYGPLAVLLFSGLNIISDQEPVALLIVFKACFFLCYAGSSIAAFYLIKNIHAKLPITSLYAFFGNPCVVYMLLIDSHVDGLIVFFLLLGFLALFHDKLAYAGLAFGCACCIKVTMFGIVPLIGLEIFNQARKQANILKFYSFFMALFLVMLFFYIVTKGGELKAVVAFATDVRITYFGPLPQLIDRLEQKILNIVFPAKPFDLTPISRAVSTALLIFALLIVYVKQFKLGSLETLLKLAGLALAVTAVAMNWFMPWYIIWGMPLIILSQTELRLKFCFLVTATLMILLYSLGNPYQASTIFFICVFLTALVWFLPVARVGRIP